MTAAGGERSEEHGINVQAKRKLQDDSVSQGQSNNTHGQGLKEVIMQYFEHSLEKQTPNIITYVMSSRRPGGARSGHLEVTHW